MAFFRTINFAEPLPIIEGDEVVLRTPQMTDFRGMGGAAGDEPRVSHAVGASWPVDDLTRAAFRRRIKRYAEDLRTDTGYAFVIARCSDGALVGGLTLANIRRGVAEAGSLGYWTGLPFVRQGYMTTAVRALVPSLSIACGCTASKLPASRAIPDRSSFWRRPDSCEKAMHASICASTAFGRTTCSTVASMAVPITAKLDRSRL